MTRFLDLVDSLMALIVVQSYTAHLQGDTFPMKAQKNKNPKERGHKKNNLELECWVREK